MASISNNLIYSILIIAIFCALCKGEDLATIVRGTKAANNEFPSMVSIQQNNAHICGGTFVTRCHVMTAAHCVEGQNLKTMRIAAGSSDQSTFRYFYYVKKVDIHPEYTQPTNKFSHDIAVIKLDQCIVEDATQQVAGVYETPLGEGVRGTVIGWGRLNFADDSSARHLQRVYTWTMTNDECLLSYKPDVVRPVQVCTTNSPGAGVCCGDSGSPLFVNGEVAGIASLTFPCAVGYPDVYTRVYDYIPWLLKIIRSD